MTIAQTDRLLLREITFEDAVDVFNLNSNPNVIKYTSDPAFKNIADAKKLIENVIGKQYADYGHGRWAVINKSNNDFLGWCGLKFLQETKEVDLGYRFFEAHWGKGFATEAATASLKYGFENFKYAEIIGRAMKENIPSIKVLKKCGMTYSHEAQLHEHPAFVYKITRREFMKALI
jgi:[ribosomal protein S5]-alanine N-acetyltransferase